MPELNLFEKSFPENEEQFRAFMDNSPIFAWAKDGQGRYRYMNKTYERSFGDRLENWAGKTDFEIWSAGTCEQFQQNDQQVLEQRRAISAIETLTQGDGGQSYLICKFPFHDATGNVLVGGIGVDITEQKRLETELNSSQQRFRTLSDLALEGVVIHGAAEIMDANASASRLFG